MYHPKSFARQIGTSDNAPIICGLSRARPSDIDRCWDAIRYARHPRIHTFIATSDIAICRYVLQWNGPTPQQQILAEIARTDVHFSSRSEIEMWMKCLDIWFSLCADRTVADISNVFIEKYAMSDAEASDVKALMQGHDYIIQTTWLLWPK